MLVEREQALATLTAAVADARRGGPGRLVLVPGEAGAGKTSVVRALLAALPDDVEALVGACDSLRTPRPFGPLHDWDRGLADAPREVVLDRVLDRLSRGPAVAVLEDVHWADEGTLDVLGFLGRRLGRTRALLLVTYRADEVGPQHPLTVVLGELAGQRPLRVPVGPLSREGVAALAAGHGLDAGDLHDRTGGNPFFVSECLSAGDRVPTTVREAVLARAGRVDTGAREALDAVAVVPGRAELWLAEALGADVDGLDACVGHGLLVAEDGAVRFRHELAREAVLDALPPGRRRALHRRAVAALRGVDDARVVHHAVAAGDADAVREHAPPAAAAAEAAGARREAVAHLQLALAHGSATSAEQRRELWARLAEQQAVLGEHDAAVASYREAVALAAQTGPEERHGELLSRMWNPLSMAGHLDDAARAVEQAVALLEGRGRTSALALACAQRCAHHMLARELADAEPWGRRALDLATQLGDDEVLAYALVQSGVALWMAGDDGGLERLHRGVALAEERGLHRLVALGLSQIGSGGGEVRRYPEAIAALERCVAYADRYELGSRGLYAQAWLARCHAELGRWDEAATALSAVLRSPRCEGITRLTALTALGRLRAQRGDPDPDGPLDEALVLARRTGHLQRLWPVAAARAEAADLRGALHEEVPLLQEVHAVAVRLRHPWAVGELGWWRGRAGAVVGADGAAAPYALLLAGQPRAAAQVWGELGCVYEQASALAQSDEDDDQRAALAAFERLGAAPAAQRLAARRRAQGLTVPRGPNARTRGNPAGLTDRELEVLRLVAAGCTNPELAARLHISPKTAGHHVSHLLSKLGARSRAEAVTAAHGLGIVLTDR